MTACATAACRAAAVTVVDGWPMCTAHAVPEPEDRPRDWHAYEQLRDWIGRLHAAGLTDPQLAAACGVSPVTARGHRKRLGLQPNRTDKQRAHADRLAREADARVSRCVCTGWTWDGHCIRCDKAVSA